MSSEALSVLTMALLAALAGYLLRQARVSRENALRRRLQCAEIARREAEQALANTVDYYGRELDRLRRRLAEGGGCSGAEDRRFRRAKAAFARLYHPDLARDERERARRAEMFKEFWAELERIEQDP